MPESKVYILGAGCSKHCEYSLGPEMKEDLEQFGRSLDCWNAAASVGGAASKNSSRHGHGAL